MATKTTKTTATINNDRTAGDQAGEERASEGEMQTTDDVNIDALLAQKAAIDAAIKAAKASVPARSRLERVIEKQRQLGGEYIYGSLAGQVIMRVQAGQDRDEAFNDVVAFWTGKTAEEVERRLSK